MTVGPALGDAELLATLMPSCTGGVVANTKVTLRRDDRAVDGRQPGLSQGLLESTVRLTKRQTAGPGFGASDPVKNEGGRINRPIDVAHPQHHRNEERNRYLSGPRLQNGQIGLLDIPVRRRLRPHCV